MRSNPAAPTPASGAAYDATVGELLHLVLQTYLQEIDQADQRIAELRGFRSVGNYDIGLTGSDLKTDYLFDLPFTVKPAGVYIDFKGATYGFVKLDSAADFSASRAATLEAEQIELPRLSVYAGSALEHQVWQQALRTDAVSTVRGLQFANENWLHHPAVAQSKYVVAYLQQRGRPISHHGEYDTGVPGSLSGKRGQLLKVWLTKFFEPSITLLTRN